MDRRTFGIETMKTFRLKQEKYWDWKIENIWVGTRKIFGLGHGKFLDWDMEKIWLGKWKMFKMKICECEK